MFRPVFDTVISQRYGVILVRAAGLIDGAVRLNRWRCLTLQVALYESIGGVL